MPRPTVDLEPEPEPEPAGNPRHHSGGLLLPQMRAQRAATAAASAAGTADHRAGYVEAERWTAGYIQRQQERRSERAMRVEKLDARLAITAKRREEFLYLSGQRLGAEAAEHLATALARCAPRVHEIYLSSALYDLGKSGWYPIASLARHHRLTKLYLGQNDIGTEGVEELVSALRGSPTLQMLELAENSIGDRGAVALAQLVSEGTGCCMSLTGLGLRGNAIGDSGALQLLQACKELPSLQWLDLGGNPITDKRVWAIRGDLLGRHRGLCSLLPVTQRLAWAQASSHRLGRSGSRPSPAYQYLSVDLIEMIGVAPLPGKPAWNGKVFQRWDIIGGMAAATNRQARERRRDPSGGSLTRSEFAEIYEHHWEELWRESATEGVSVCSSPTCRGAGTGMTSIDDQLRWDESTIESASKKELLAAIQAVGPERWLRERQLNGKLRTLLRKTSAAHVQASYLALQAALLSSGQWLVELEDEPEEEREPEVQPEPTPPPPADLEQGASPGLTREQVEALAQIGDVGVVLRGTAIAGGGIVQGQLRRSQGRRNGKVLTRAGEIVWFSLADVESGNVLVVRS